MVRSIARAAARVGLLPPLLLTLSGCGAALVGDWRLLQAVPSREVFCLEDVSFDRDGNFAATTTLDGRTAREKGTYQFSGFQLTLRPAAGGQRRYDARLKLNQLEVRRGRSLVLLEKGKSRNATPPPRDEPVPENRAADEPERGANEPHVIHEQSPPK